MIDKYDYIVIGAGGDIGHESVRDVYKMIRNQNY